MTQDIYRGFIQISRYTNPNNYNICKAGNDIINGSDYKIFSTSSNDTDVFHIYKNDTIFVNPISIIEISEIKKPTVCVFKNVFGNYFMAKVFKILSATKPINTVELQAIYNSSDFTPIRKDIIRFKSFESLIRNHKGASVYGQAMAICCIVKDGTWTIELLPAKEIYGIVKYTHHPGNFTNEIIYNI